MKNIMIKTTISSLFFLFIFSCNKFERPKVDCKQGERETRIRYKELNTDTCQSENQTRTCTNGIYTAWSGTFIYDQCSKISLASLASESPFGIHDPNIGHNYNYMTDMKDINAKWVRHAGISGIIWDLIEVSKGVYQWEYFDKIYHEAITNNIQLFVNINAHSDLYGKRGRLPNDLDAYRAFLSEAVKRYPEIKVWQIGNELENTWNDTYENYAILLNESFKVIKKENHVAQIALAGFATSKSVKDNLNDLLNNIDNICQKECFNIFDVHWSGQFPGNYRYQGIKSKPETVITIPELVNLISDKLKNYNYKNIPIWITEMSFNTGTPVEGDGMNIFLGEENRTEGDQAIELFKRYTYSIVKNVKKIFWSEIMEWYNFDGAGAGGYFDLVGLITNPRSSDGSSHKKLSYYTYKLIVEKLEGSDWDNIETIQESDNIYIYRFINKETKKSTLVAWNDGIDKEITINNLNYYSSVLITESVPDANSGEVLNSANFSNFFKQTSTAVVDNKLDLLLSKNPVFIESSETIRK